MNEIAKEDLAQARATASQIRQGIHNYLATLALIDRAWREGHWRVLGYDSWETYVDGEFGEERLRLPAEHRRKAVEELRLAGMSNRAIAAAVGADERTVRRDLSGAAHAAPAEITGTDGKSYAASRPSQPAAKPVEADAPLDAHAPAAVREAETAPPVEAGDGAGELTGAPAPQTAAEDHPATGLQSLADADGEVSRHDDTVRANAAGAPVDTRDELVGSSSSPVGAPVNPIEHVLANDPAVQAADYLAQFTSALSRAGGFMSFDAERVAQLAGTSTWDAVEAHASVVAHWFSTAQKARRGLRVIKGGVA